MQKQITTGYETGAHAKPLKPFLGMSLQSLIRAIAFIGWGNVAVGLFSISAVLLLDHVVPSVMVWGMLSLCAFLLTRVKIYYIKKSHSWLEVSLTIICGLYVPTVIGMIAVMKLAISLSRMSY